MSNKTKRRSFQIHLSTAVVMMFVAGGLVWLNTIPDIGMSNGVEIEFPRVDERYLFLGWPVWNRLQVVSMRTGSLKYSQWLEPGQYFDAFITFGILCGSAIVCEYLLRRRESRERKN